jgi:hypothetical protein
VVLYGTAQASQQRLLRPNLTRDISYQKSSKKLAKKCKDRVLQQETAAGALPVSLFPSAEILFLLEAKL